MVDMSINPTQESESTEQRFEKKREAAEHRRLMLKEQKMIKKGKVSKTEMKAFRLFFKEFKSMSADAMAHVTYRFSEKTGLQRNDTTGDSKFLELNVDEVREESINNPTVDVQ